MAGQHPQDVFSLADLGSLVRVLVEELDSTRIDGEKFIREVREAVRRAEIVVAAAGQGRGR